MPIKNSSSNQTEVTNPVKFRLEVSCAYLVFSSNPKVKILNGNIEHCIEFFIHTVFALIAAHFENEEAC